MQIINAQNQEGEVPTGFEWAEECCPSDEIPGAAGCNCTGECRPPECPCASAHLRKSDTSHLLVLPVADPTQLELTECGPACKCCGACTWGFSSAISGIRVTFGSGDGSGGAASAAVSLQKSANKGWCAYANKDLPEGLILCHYAGEYLKNAEAQRRLAEYDAAGRGHALLVLRVWLPSGTAAVRINIDATRRGSLARFLNHSCDGGNLRLVLGRRTSSLIPRVLFVTSRPLARGEELTWAYGPPNNGERGGPGGRPCHCGTPACLGFMPHDHACK